ncbi:MAG: hypothetical protein Q4Q03_02045 [Bowdeniella nasicola]|nr:hypothetical protein [Bowdeniella nasicola]
MPIVNIADGSQVDTTALEELARCVQRCCVHLGEASTAVGTAMAAAQLSPSTPGCPPVRITELASLLSGPNSIGKLLGVLHELLRELRWASAAYQETEMRVGTAFAMVSAPSLPLLPLSALTQLITGEGMYALLGDHHLAPAIATQRRIARLAGALWPQAYLSSGRAGSYPTQRVAGALTTWLGLRNLDGAVIVRPYRTTAMHFGHQRVTPVDNLHPNAPAGSHGVNYYHQLRGEVVQQPIYVGTSTQWFDASPRGIGNYVGTLGRLNALSQARGEMIIQIDQVRRPHADEVWVVHIPGTSAGSDLLSSNPANHDANLGLLAGQQTDVQRAVTRAMQAAAVPTGAEVVLTGHSQGGLAAMNLIRDHDFLARYRVRSVLTCGSPIGVLAPPETVRTLHLENLADTIPALDGTANSASATHVTIQFIHPPTGALSDAHPHAMAGYQHAVTEAAASDDPRAHMPIRHFAGAVGLIGGAQVTSRMFRVRRSRPVYPRWGEPRRQTERYAAHAALLPVR